MKKILLLGCMLVGLLAQSEAQQSSSKKKGTVRKSTAKKAKASPRNETSVVLTNSSANQARGAASQLRISDPTVLELNRRSNGAAPTTQPVIGMPKSTYGIANGKILLRNTTATTPGTAYGSGAVGTGTSIAGAGTSETTLGVNGKSPYAGPWLWGDRRSTYTVADSARRQ